MFVFRSWCCIPLAAAWCAGVMTRQCRPHKRPLPRLGTKLVGRIQACPLRRHSQHTESLGGLTTGWVAPGESLPPRGGRTEAVSLKYLVAEAEGKLNNKTQKNITGSAVELDVSIKPRPPPTLEKNTHGGFSAAFVVLLAAAHRSAATRPRGRQAS